MRLACVAVVLAMICARADAATPMAWRIDRFANEFWVLDKLAAAETEDGPSDYIAAFEKIAKLDDAKRKLLHDYARVRRDHSRTDRGEPDVRTPVDLLPPAPGPEEQFAIAFLTAKDEAAAAVKLKLSATERTAVLAAFAGLRKDIDALLAGATYLEAARATLTAHAKASNMGDFLDAMKVFYGVDDATPYTVELLWAPPGNGQATVWDHEIVLPISAATAADPKHLDSWLGVVVHECGHAFLAEKTTAQKADLSRRIVAGGGLVNARHANVIDEATQTALGNIIFTRTRLPAGYEPRSFYGYEPDNDYPDAIDSLARAIEPLAAAALATRDGFTTVYLAKALAEQRRLFGDTPRHHSHVAIVFASDSEIEQRFDGLFFGRSRWNYLPAKLADLTAASRAAPDLTRWLMTTNASLVAKLGVAPLALGTHAACTRATQRTADGGWDILVVARDSDAMRRMLIAVHRADAMPETPLCL